MIFFPEGKTTTSMINLFQILYIIVGPRCNLSKSVWALFTSPNKIKLIQKLFWHQHSKNFQHIFKFHTRPISHLKIIECHREKILHFDSNFHIAPTNIFSKHLWIPTLNSRVKKITQLGFHGVCVSIIMHWKHLDVDAPLHHISIGST